MSLHNHTAECCTESSFAICMSLRLLATVFVTELSPACPDDKLAAECPPGPQSLKKIFGDDWLYIGMIVGKF